MFLIASIIPILIIGILSINRTRNSMEELIYASLESSGIYHKEKIISFLEQKKNDLEILSIQKETVEAFAKLKTFHDTGGATPNGGFDIESIVYENIYNEIDPFFRSYLNLYYFDDVFMICAEHAHVMYSVLKEDDLGTNLSNGKYRDSNLAKLWSKVVSTKKTEMVDFEFYSPSNKNATFIGTPVFDEENKLIAMLALQLSTEKINEIMQNVTEIGKTSEAYLVGDDFLMRSNSKFSNQTDILKQKVQTRSVELGLKDVSGTHLIENYRGDKVLSFYDDLGLNELFGTNFEWVVVTEITKKEAFKKSRFLTSIIIVIGLILLIINFVFARFAATRFAKPILQLEESANKMAKGDLSEKIEVETDDEIGTLADTFRLMQKNLRNQLKELSVGVNVLSSSSSQIMSMVSELASGSAETAASVSETTSTIEEVKQTAEISSQKSEEVSDMAQKISEVSQDGMKSMVKTIEGMNKIKSQMENIARIVMQLSEKSNTIGDIANDVKDLADQSNLLAVNASIEAAKAGEYGKGFSVVAQEIKNLADRSKKSTLKIRSIVSDIQKEITNAVMATDQGNKVIELGLELSSNANEVITTLSAGVDEASQSNIQIAASSQQQLIGMEQIATAMENIKEASAQGTLGARQTEESIVELKSLGGKLLEIVEQYKL